MIRMFTAPGRGIGRLVTGAMGLSLKAVSTIVGSQMMSDASAFVKCRQTSPAFSQTSLPSGPTNSNEPRGANSAIR